MKVKKIHHFTNQNKQKKISTKQLHTRQNEGFIPNLLPPSQNVKHASPGAVDAHHAAQLPPNCAYPDGQVEENASLPSRCLGAGQH